MVHRGLGGCPLWRTCVHSACPGSGVSAFGVDLSGNAPDLGCSNRRYEVKKFHAYRALSVVAAIVAVVVESGAGHKF